MLPPSAFNELLPLISAGEGRARPDQDARRTGPHPGGIVGLFERQVEKSLTATALVFQRERVTYGELNVRADDLAARLRRMGVAPETLVGICLERSVEMVVAILAVLKAGGAYVPLDPAYPRERLAFIVEDTRMPVLLTQHSLAGLFPNASTCVVSIDSPFAEPAAQDRPSPHAAPVLGENLAYVIYTSGSTGRPKGVCIEHRQTIALIEWARTVFDSDDLAGVLFSTSICFDLSVFELFLPLSCGGKVILAANALELPALPARDEVTLINTVPSAIAELVRIGGIPASVRTVNLAGEPLTQRLVREIYRQETIQRVFDLYGPSETTTYSTFALRMSDGPATIGRAITGTTVHLLDAALQAVPDGEPGELCIGGAGVSRGYWDRPELTAEKFIPDPFSDDGKSRLYRTGDVARFMPDGNLEYLGRIDHQVKIRGFRIELGEIESVMEQHAAVREAVAVAREKEPGDVRLVAYLNCAPGLQLDEVELRDFLKRKLPDYMVPAVFVVLDTFPRTPNGKLDRKVLPEPDWERGNRGDAEDSPRSPTEEVLAGIWCAVLGIGRVGLGDNFFELGGHSLLATRVTSRVRDLFRVELSLSAFFETPTVRELAARIDLALGAAPPSLQTPVVRTPRNGALPLSFAQERLWMVDQLERNRADYNVAMALRLGGELDAAILQRCLDEVVRRHESLRTRFQENAGSAVQVIDAAVSVEMPLIDLSALPEAEREIEAMRRCEGEASRAFDLAADRLIRATLLRLAPTKHVLFLNVHHIAMDDWSAGLLMDEMAALYRAYRDGAPSPLPELAIQYADFAVWQREWLRGEVLEKQVSYWMQRLHDAPALLELPTDRARPAVQTHRGAVETALYGLPLAEALRALSREEGVTLFMTLVAAFKVLLSRLSGQEDVVVGSPIAGRNRTEIEGLIGFFVNTLVLRSDLSGDPGFREVLARVRETTLGAYAHQDLPFEKLVEELKPERNLSYSPLCQVIFALQHLPAERHGSGLNVELDWVPTGTAKFDLSLVMIETPAGLKVLAEYGTDLFERETIARLLGHFQTLLEGIVTDPATLISALPLLTAEQRREMLVGWNSTEAEYPRDRCIHDLFEAQAERAPETVALIFEEQQLTYRELNERANRFARFLKNRGAGPEVLVGLCMERSLEMVVSLLGILKAGAAYVPLDPAYPKERLAFIMADAALPILVTQSALLAKLPESAAQIVCFDTSLDEILREDAGKPASGVGAENLAYVIYTSGSTGQPKGVLVPHRGLANVSEAQARAFHPRPGDRVLQFASISFDASIFEIMMALSNGAALCLGSQDDLMPGPGLVRFLREREVTIVTLPPSALAALPAAELPALRIITVAGEACRAELVAQWAPGRRFFNLYGPTETTIWATMAECHPGDITPPIGRPIINTQVYVLDRHLHPVPAGVSGELFIGGDGLARGYLNRPELTARSFVANPFSAQTGARLYKTGDLARHRRDGNLEFLGRVDHQVKVRGFRIELGEIEIVLRQHPAVSEAVVVAREGADGDQRLAAYVVASGEREPTAIEIQSFLKEKLPEYLVPATFTILEALPLTASGKIDRKALPAPALPGTCEGGSYVPPASPIEERLARIWAAVLRVDRVGMHDNFFALGGHSLLAGQLLSRVRDGLRVELSLRAVFEDQSVRALAKRIESMISRAGGTTAVLLPPVVRVPRDGGLPLSFAQERLWFLDQLEPDRAVYNVAITLRLRGALETTLLERCLTEIVRRHESLRTRFELCNGAPIQVITAPQAVEMPCLDLSTLPAAQRCVDEARRPFDLAHDRLLRAVLFRIAPDEHLLFLNVHHIAMDEWSAALITGELTALYTAFAAGQPSPLEEPSVQYADYAVWQRKWLSGDRLEKQLGYWRDQLAGAPALLELPADRPRPPVQSHRGALEIALFERPLAEELQALSRAEGVSFFMVLLAAFQVLLSRLSGSEDIVIGSPSAGRSRTEIENLIGFFVNLLVLRCDLSGDPTFRELIDRVRAVTLGAYAHQEVSFEKLVENLKPARNLSYSPLCQVIFALQHLPVEQPRGDLRVELDWVPTGMAKFDLSVTMIETNAGLRVMADYSTDLFDRETIALLLSQFRTLLEAITAHPDARIGALPLMTAAERTRVLLEWNRTDAPYPRELCIHELFEAQVKKTPEAAALAFEGQQLTYRELDTQADRVAAALRARGVGPEVLVGLCLERSLEMIVGLLGILKAGGAYVPLDPSLPKARLAFMIADTAMPILLTQRSLLAALPPEPPAVEYLEIESLVASDPQGNTDGTAGTRATSANLVYVMYTSGSTGTPKAVAIEHRQLVNYVTGIGQSARFGEGWSFATVSSLSADLGNTAIFPPLCSGGCVHVIAQQRILDPEAFAAYFDAHAIDCLKIVPSHLVALQTGPAPERAMPRKCLILAGEPLSIELAARLRRLAPHCVICNHYGPTETAVAVLAYNLDGEIPAGPSRTVPLGRPIANTRIYILDQSGEPTPVGVPGEIHIGGSSVGRCYLGRPELTAERFVPDPFSGTPGARLYRTGDRARQLADGSIEFLGRLDEQVKIRGFRIELAEVEGALATHPLIRRAAVVVRESAGGEPVLLAFVAAQAGEELSAAALRAHLREQLPDYMVPSGFVFLEEIPLTTSGKVDRRALPQVDAADRAEASPVSPPRNAKEIELVRIWEEALGKGPIGVRDNFFDLGGHSLMAAKIIGELRRTLGVHVPLAMLFLNPTIEELARVLPASPETGTGGLIQLTSGSAPRKLIFIIGEFGMQLMRLAPLLRDETPLFASVVPLPHALIEAVSAGGKDLPSMEDLASLHVEQILRHAPAGPFLLAGYCFEGLLAIEVARQLLQHGRAAEAVFLFDASVTADTPGWRFAWRECRVWMRRNYELTRQRGWRYLWNKIQSKRLRAQMGRASRLDPRTPVPPADAGNEDPTSALHFARVAIVRELYGRTHQAYQPQSLPCRGVLFLSEDAVSLADEPSLGASRVFTEGLDIIKVPGDHGSMLLEPNVRALARRFKACLETTGALVTTIRRPPDG